MKFQYLLLTLLFVQSIFGQSKLPLIRATSKNIAINDGGFLDKNAWTLSPETRPDIYTADRTRAPKWVTFYTDIDSIKVKVKPGTVFNFIILLNGKDSCYTQIASALPPKSKIIKNEHDTIPFILTAYNAIHVQSIINDRDTLNLHFDLGSFDFHLTKDAILKKTKLLSTQPDALAGKATPNYNRLEKVYKIQIGNLIVNNPDVIPTGFTAHEMDGRFGWDIFEDKTVEIDYDNSRLIVHSKLPGKLKGYSKSKIDFIHSFICIDGAIAVRNKKYKGKFLFDTGSDMAMILDSSWMKKQNFPTDLTLLKTTTFQDPRGVEYKNKIVLCPSLEVNDLPLSNIPTTLLGSKNPVGFEVNYFGNDLLKRFNTIIDFHNDIIYLKPNKMTALPYKAV